MRLAAGLAAALALGLAAPATALAHATVESTSPSRGAALAKEPERVVFRFSESVETQFGAVRVFDARGRRVDRGATSQPTAASAAVRLRPGLPDGAYTATYNIVSADSHPVSGGFSFTIGEPAESGGGGGHPDRRHRVGPGDHHRLRRDQGDRVRRHGPSGRWGALPLARLAGRPVRARARPRARPGRRRPGPGGHRGPASSSRAQRPRARRSGARSTPPWSTTCWPRGSARPGPCGLPGFAALVAVLAPPPSACPAPPTGGGGGRDDAGAGRPAGHARPVGPRRCDRPAHPDAGRRRPPRGGDERVGRRGWRS